MSAVTFDTLKFVEILEAAKVPREQATAFATAVRITQDTDNVATKNDVADLRKDIEAMSVKIEASENRIIVKLGKRVVATVTVTCTIMTVMIAALIKFL